MPQRVYTASGGHFVATDRYMRADNRRCLRYMDAGACHSSGCQMHGRRCQSATTPIVNASPMMQKCAAISPASHQGTWAAQCVRAGCRADRGMACVPRLALSPRKRKRRRRRGGAAATHATDAPRIFIRGTGEAVLIKIDHDRTPGAPRYTVRYVAPPQETAVIENDQIRRVKWGLYGRLKLRPFPRIMGEKPCSYYGRRLLYDHSHSSEEVQRCMARLCAREEADNAFCDYGEAKGKIEPPGGVEAMVQGIGRILAKFCTESPDALESEICQVYQNLTRACQDEADHTSRTQRWMHHHRGNNSPPTRRHPRWTWARRLGPGQTTSMPQGGRRRRRCGWTGTSVRTRAVPPGAWQSMAAPRIGRVRGPARRGHTAVHRRQVQPVQSWRHRGDAKVGRRPGAGAGDISS